MSNRFCAQGTFASKIFFWNQDRPVKFSMLVGLGGRKSLPGNGPCLGSLHRLLGSWFSGLSKGFASRPASVVSLQCNAVLGSSNK